MRQDDFNDLLDSVKEAGKIKRGEIAPSRSFNFEPQDIKGIRKKLQLTQLEFAMMIGVSVATLRNWEQGRRVPEGPARALLRIAESNPEAVLHALGA